VQIHFGDFFAKFFCFRAGLPDGLYIFKPKTPIGVILDDLTMEDVGLSYVHLVYFTAVWYILR
jgi:hypothetical protein